jgi:hypothetical protein
MLLAGVIALSAMVIACGQNNALVARMFIVERK